MNMSFQNVLDADGIGIAITGMLIVFSGLVLISLYIASIPSLLRRLESGFKKISEKRAVAPVPAVASLGGGTELTDEMLSAIAYVIHMEKEYEDAEDHQRITVQRDETNQVWAVTGRLRNLSNRM